MADWSSVTMKLGVCVNVNENGSTVIHVYGYETAAYSHSIWFAF